MAMSHVGGMYVWERLADFRASAASLTALWRVASRGGQRWTGQAAPTNQSEAAALTSAPLRWRGRACTPLAWLTPLEAARTSAQARSRRCNPALTSPSHVARRACNLVAPRRAIDPTGVPLDAVGAGLAAVTRTIEDVDNLKDYLKEDTSKGHSAKYMGTPAGTMGMNTSRLQDRDIWQKADSVFPGTEETIGKCEAPQDKVTGHLAVATARRWLTRRPQRGASTGSSTAAGGNCFWRCVGARRGGRAREPNPDTVHVPRSAARGLVGAAEATPNQFVETNVDVDVTELNCALTLIRGGGSATIADIDTEIRAELLARSMGAPPVRMRSWCSRPRRARRQAP